MFFTSMPGAFYPNEDNNCPLLSTRIPLTITEDEGASPLRLSERQPPGEGHPFPLIFHRSFANDQLLQAEQVDRT
jgi:hypothetical protein